MIEEQDIYPVPWDRGWDETIERQIEQGRIGRAGGDGDSVLFLPGRLLVDVGVARNRRVQSVLKSVRATPTRSQERAIAGRLGLRLYETADPKADASRLVDLVREINSIAPRSASLDHVLIAGPARWGGDGVPAAIGDPKTVPGADPGLGKGITVAVLDTGIAAKVPFSVDAGPGDAEIPDEDGDKKRDPPAGHGTHVAGLVVSVAAGARIVARRMLTTVAGVASDLAVARALLENADADIINCSFSGPTLGDAPPLIVERALALLPAKTVVVACAGNTGTDRPQWPAASKGVIAVGAIAPGGRGTPWLQPDFTNHGWWVDCCAPGVGVPSTFLRYGEFDGFATWTGTSMSCPQVAGAIAAIASRDGIDVSLAAYRLVYDPARPRMQNLGAVVDPANLP
jgi:subtilisin family serine protease